MALVKVPERLSELHKWHVRNITCLSPFDFASNLTFLQRIINGHEEMIQMCKLHYSHAVKADRRSLQQDFSSDFKVSWRNP